ncbi:LLM class flavin-dependent oxidoreductase [Virgibacillus kimchii]
MKLSILDQAPVSSGSTAQQALTATLELAQSADRLGYTRYWVAEHHDLPGLASPAPDVLLGMIGLRTEQIRIGAGAVLLPHYKPFNIAERYHMLATLNPGRIDLGIGRAPGGSAEVTMALSDNFLENVRKMPDKLDDLLAFLNGSFPDGHLFSKIKARPVPNVPPVPWLLGTSGKSGKLAVEKGMNYAFGHFMSGENGPEIVEDYYKSGGSRALIAVTAVCAETTEEAEECALSDLVWKLQQEKGKGKSGVPTVEEAKAYELSNEEKNKLEKMKNNMIIGNPQEVKEQLEKLQVQYGTDEFMIVTITHSYDVRRKSYELIAEACGL